VTGIDAVRLNFSPESLVALDVILAFVLFGVALDIRVADFKGLLTSPRGTIIGLFAHSVLLPAVAWVLTMVLKPEPSIALGMILVASCPSGNISNFLVNYARGNTALSVTIAAFSMLGSILFTPFNLAFWGALNPATRPILHAVALSPWEVLGAEGRADRVVRPGRAAPGDGLGAHHGAQTATEHRARHDPRGLLPRRQRLELPHELRARQHGIVGDRHGVLDRECDVLHALQHSLLGLAQSRDTVDPAAGRH